MSRDLADFAATELLAGYRSREFSPIEVMEAVQRRIQEREPVVKALWAADPDRAMLQARESTQRWQKQSPKGLLDGVPFTLKENIATSGTVIPLGSAATDLQPATFNAPPAARSFEAGAILLGKTTMPAICCRGAGGNKWRIGASRAPRQQAGSGHLSDLDHRDCAPRNRRWDGYEDRGLAKQTFGRARLPR